MRADHFDVLDTEDRPEFVHWCTPEQRAHVEANPDWRDTNPTMGRWCDWCDRARHGDCKPSGCRASRDD